MKRRSQFHKRAHLYAGDGIVDHAGADRCQHCGLARVHTIHTLPPTDPAVTEVEARRAGERMPAGQEQSSHTNNAEGTPA